MPISSLILRTRPQQTQDVITKIKALPQVSVSEVRQENVIVVTDTDRQSQDKTIWEQLNQIPGVVQCDLIYFNFEDEEGFHD